MPVTIRKDNPRVFVCREGHVSKTANGIDRFTCRKEIILEGGEERHCRKKALVLDEGIAHALHRRGWENRVNRTATLISRIFDEISINGQATIEDAPEA